MTITKDLIQQVINEFKDQSLTPEVLQAEYWPVMEATKHQLCQFVEPSTELLILGALDPQVIQVIRTISIFYFALGRAYGKAELQPQLDSQVDKILGT